MFLADIVDFADLIAINGFQSESNHIRLAVQSKQKQDQIDLYYGTWSDSLLHEMNFAIFLVGNKKVQSFENGCAYLFSECNFKGQEFKICGNIDSVKEKVEIKSIHKLSMLTKYVFRIMILTIQKFKHNYFLFYNYSSIFDFNKYLNYINWIKYK
ncbi:hypothetical protein pb186bvf_015053 [Paramecium bursaria]